MTFRSTITPDQQAAILDRVMTHDIATGVGTEETACSIASINLALLGRLTDEIPDCMSPVIGKWIIVVQDAMPDEMRNSVEWRQLLPLAAGTGRDREAERLAIILDWMWSTVLPSIQPVADAGGYGEQWRAMCAERTPAAATAASWASWAEASWAAAAATAAATAAEASRAAVEAAAAAAARAAERAAAWAAPAAWTTFAPADLLRRLIYVEQPL